MPDQVAAATSKFPGVSQGEKLAEELSVRVWTPEGDSIGVVVILHGIHEHGGRYDGFVGRLVAERWSVIAPDLPGHGLSRGQCGRLGRLEEVFAALEDTVDRHVAGVYGGLPRVIFGHSMGGALALLLAERRPKAWDGVIVTGAATCVSGSPLILMPILRLLAQVAPTFGVRRISAEDVAVSPGGRASYSDDPLVVQGAVQARSAWTLWSAGRNAEAGLAAITSPILVLYGEADALAAPAGSKVIAERVSSTDVTVLSYAGQGHELLNEDVRDDVIYDIMRWLDERFGEGSPR